MYLSLRKKKDIENVMKRGRTKHTQFFIFKFIKSDDNNAKAVIVVSKKISKSAVVRNKNRRKIREALRISKIRVGHHYAIIPKIDISEEKQKNIEEDLNKIL